MTAQTGRRIQPIYDGNWDFANVSRTETTYLTHNYHTYPAKYIPQLVSKIILEHSPPGGVVLDPFCGSGTTCVEALLNDRQARGVDINPVAILITQAKTTPLAPKKLSLALTQFWDAYQQQSPTEVLPGATPEQQSRFEHWFPPAQRPELLNLWAATQCSDPGVRNFLQCAFSSILKYCSMWNPRSNKPCYFPGKTFPLRPAEKMRRALTQMIGRNELFYRRRPGRRKVIKRGSAYATRLAAESVDLVATSPPYVTSYEYADLHQLSALFLGISHNDKKFRGNFTGSVYAERAGALNSARGDEIVAQLSAQDKKLGAKCGAYFYDTNRFFGEMSRVLKPGGQLGVVIGDTYLRDVAIKNSVVYAEQMTSHGLRLTKCAQRKISSKMLPSTRDKRTGKFVSAQQSSAQTYTDEFILFGKK